MATERGRVLLLRKLEVGSTGAYSVAFSPNGRWLASSSEDGTLRLWDARRLWEVDRRAGLKVLHAYRRGANAVTFSPEDDDLLALAGDDGMLQLWNATATASPPKILRAGEESVLAVAFSPNGRLLASAYSDGAVRLWETASAAERKMPQNHEGPVFSLAFSPDRDLLASGSDDHTVRLWDLAGTAEPRILRDHEGIVFSVAFSPKESLLLGSASEDGTVRLWDLAGASGSRVLRRHEGAVRAIAFSPDGSLLASASHDGAVRLSDVSSGSETEVLAPHEGELRAVAFSPDGRLLASASYSSSRSIRLWNTTSLGIGPTLDLGSYRAVVAADTLRGIDAIGIEADARSFARLIMDREVEPPLAIGVFGEWGSGKSFFMRQLSEQIDIIAKTASGGFCHEVAHIEFNAWHYVEANLWASLVNHIFTCLHQWLSSDIGKDATESLFAQLRSAKELDKETQTALRRAKGELEAAKQDLEERRNEAQKTIRNAPWRNLKIEDLPTSLEKRVSELKQETGLGQIDTSIDSLQRTLADFRGLGGEIRAMHRAWNQLPRWKQWVFGALVFVGSLILFDFGGLLSAHVFPGLSGLVGKLAASMTMIGVGLASLIRHSRAILGLAEWLRIGLREQETAEEKALIDQLTFQVHQAEERVAGAKREVLEAEAAIEDEDLSRRLTRFIEGRANSGDYQQQLGIVAMIRRDIESVDKLLRARRADTSDAADSSIIERIVLYIDDLDRCPTPRVVQVLEAIHLLLAFPLFVVVVGVDVRWMQRSLLDHYPRHLGNVEAGLKLTDGEATSDGNAESFEMEDLATPHDYLEKIFQIPFWLQQLEGRASRRLVASLTEARTTEDRAGTDKETVAIENAAAVAEVQERRTSDLVSGNERSSGTATGSSQATRAPQPPDPVVFEEHERAFMLDLAPYAGTSPRRVKRFVNVYRIVKASVPREERTSFLAHDGRKGSCHAVLTLLALTTGAPHLASEIFGRIEQGIDHKAILKAIEARRAPTDSRELAAAVGAIRLYAQQQHSSDGDLRLWLPRIRSFTFQFGRLRSAAVVPTTSPASKTEAARGRSAKNKGPAETGSPAGRARR